MGKHWKFIFFEILGHPYGCYYMKNHLFWTLWDCSKSTLSLRVFAVLAKKVDRKWGNFDKLFFWNPGPPYALYYMKNHLFLALWDCFQKYQFFKIFLLFMHQRSTGYHFLWDLDQTKYCNDFYIQFRQSLAKETFSYDEHLKS